MTITTSATVSSSSNFTSETDARIVFVRSVRMRTLMEEGSVAVSVGSSALIRSTTVMMFAPGCRWMFRTTAGVVSIHAACRTFSTSSTTFATSASATGAPFR